MDESEDKAGKEVSTDIKSGCSFCQEPDPVKKCSKNHWKCKGKLFCRRNTVKHCELSFHKMEQAAKEDAKNKAEESVEVDENKIKLAKEFEAAAKEEKARLKKTKKKRGKTTKRVHQK